MEEKKLSKYRKSNILPILEKWFKDSAQYDTEWKERAKEWYSYYIGDQWTQDEISELSSRGQAASVYNHISPAIDSIIGGERQNRPEIRMAGRTPDDEHLAEVKTSLYDYIEYNTDTDDQIDKQMLDFLIAGRGWIYVTPEVEKDKNEILHEYVDYRDMFIDPLSKKDDLTDSRYVTQARFTDSDIIKKQFPKFKEEENDKTTLNFESSSEDGLWYEQSDRQRPRLIITFFKDEEDNMTVVIWVKGQILYFKKQPYEYNDYPFSCMTYKRDLDNYPYGLVKAMISPQDEVNKRHSKALHLLNSKQVLAEEDAFKDWDEAKKTLARPDGITKLNDSALVEGRVQILDNTPLATAQIQMMEHAKTQVLALAGINSSFIGQGGEYASGKKSENDVAAAANVLAPMLNKIRNARHRLAKITMALVPQFFSTERLIRILDINGKYAFMPINQVALLDDGTIKVLNDITANDVDIIVEDAPASLNDRREQFNQLLGIQGQTGRPIPMEILLRYSNLKDKYQLAKDLEAHYQTEAQMQEMQQYIQQLEKQVQQAGGQVDQIQSQLVQANVARAVDSEVHKVEKQIDKEKNAIVNGLKDAERDAKPKKEESK